MAAYYRQKKIQKKPRAVEGIAPVDKGVQINTSGLGAVKPKTGASQYAVNTSGNKRDKLRYKNVYTSKGVIHDYPGTKNDTLVKPKKKPRPGTYL